LHVVTSSPEHLLRLLKKIDGEERGVCTEENVHICCVVFLFVLVAYEASGM